MKYICISKINAVRNIFLKYTKTICQKTSQTITPNLCMQNICKSKEKKNNKKKKKKRQKKEEFINGTTKIE